MKASVLYVFSIVLVNWGFSVVQAIEVPLLGRYDPWALAVGIVFITRDFAQRSIGHKVWIPMAIGIALSYVMADPFVAIASAAAFAVSECVDWIVYTVSKRPLKDRILLSSGCSTPIDTVVFLSIIGALSPLNAVVSIASKMASALVVWGGMRHAKHV